MSKKYKEITVKLEDLISKEKKEDIERLASMIQRKIKREKRRQERDMHKDDK